jgi:hypothetical protein
VRGSLKYPVPRFLEAVVNQKDYNRWLHRKARAHFGRDKGRGNSSATNERYKMAIHDAVAMSDGRDYYTGELLDWSLLSQYRNAESIAGKRGYKAKFALLPTVDHVSDGLGDPDFKVCAWRTNGAKADMIQGEFIDLCRKVVEHFDKDGANQTGKQGSVNPRDPLATDSGA